MAKTTPTVQYTDDELATEVWKAIPGFEGYYEVSDLGRVRSLDRVIEGGRWGWERRRGQLMAGSVDQKNYHQVTLRSRGGKQVTRKTHHMVLEAFVGPRPVEFNGCHWDDDPTNNRLSNLRWASVSSNAFDRVRNGRNALANRTHCPRGHELNELNNVATYAEKGYRSCLACSRAYNDGRTAKKNGAKNVDMYATADAHYEAIMAGLPSPNKRKPLSTAPKAIATRERRRKRKELGLPHQ